MFPLQTSYHAEAKAVYLVGAGIILGADPTCAYESFTLVSRLRRRLSDRVETRARSTKKLRRTT